MKPLVIGLGLAVVLVGGLAAKTLMTPSVTFKWSSVERLSGTGYIKNEGSAPISGITLSVPVSSTSTSDTSIQVTQDGKCIGQPSKFTLEPGASMMVAFWCGGLTESTAPECQSESGAVRVSVVR